MAAQTKDELFSDENETTSGDDSADNDDAAPRKRRAIWAGTLGFGLVSIPVKLFSAIAEKDVRFQQVHDADGARVRQERICTADGAAVPYSHVVKAFPAGRDRLVLVTRDELAALDPVRTRRIDVEDFVELAEIDPIFYGQTYYVAPDHGGERAYRLLLAALERRGRVGIARVVLRGKQYLCAVRPRGDALVLALLHYRDEILDPGQLTDLPARGETPSGIELRLAEQIIDALSARFTPEKYRDEYREMILTYLERKARGDATNEAAPATSTAPPSELVTALEASVAQVTTEGAPESVRRPKGKSAA